ncbi:MAG: helix-turn-helix domain-containing protein [Prevotella sp.]|nr:helix-turn-helix domain-containing protein [Candidatus Prevotella equi]
MQLSFALCVSADGEIWRRSHYDDHNGMSQWHATKILQDSNGFMWFATWNGLNRFDGYEFAVFKSYPGDGNDLTSDRIRNILMGDDGNIYCGINDHVWRFNLATYKFEKPDAATEERYRARINCDTSVFLPSAHSICGHDFANARQIFSDNQKNVWVLTSYGVDKLSLQTQPVMQLNTVPKDIIRSVYRDNKKRIWITARNSGVVTVLDSVANLIGYLGTDGRLHKEPVRFASVFCVYQQKNGTIWLGAKPDGLFRLRETGASGTFAIDHFMKGDAKQIARGATINANAIYDIKEDKKGRLWIATHNGGLNLVENPNAETLHFCNVSNTFKSFPKDSYNMRRLLIVGDSLMLATSTEGFLVMKNIMGAPKDVQFTLHQRESHRASSLSCSAVMDMVIDRKGRLFISTESGGVNMLLTKDIAAKTLDFKHYTTDVGMGSDVCLAMTEIGDEILVQCNNQLTRLNVDMGKKENYNSRFFSENAIFSDAAPLLLKDGRWIIALESGVVMMTEQTFHHRGFVPKIVLTSVSIPERTTAYNVGNIDTLRLSSTERDATITFAALDFCDNSNIKYVTRIIKESSWFGGNDTLQSTLPRDQRVITLYNLTPGTYVLEISSTNAEGLWADNIRRLTIIVEPMFWETPLAYLIYILLLVIVISGITYTVTYIRQLKRQREENLQAYLTLLNPQPVDEPKEERYNVAPNAARMSKEDEVFMRRLMTYVEENVGNSDIGVDEMASATATSRSTLNRRMKGILGVTPSDFLKEVRMKKACQMLNETTKGINEIAYACGFADPKYFSKCFKSSIGLSPSEYRAREEV